MPDERTVRFGGREEPGGHVFEISGGDPALDLANTVDDRPTERRRDHLASYQDLASWAVQAGAITGAQERRLLRAAAARPAAARRVLSRALRLREAIFELFVAVAAGRPLPPEPLGVLNAFLPRALSRLRLSPAGDAAAWSWEAEGEPLDRMLWPVVRAAADLLTSGEAGRVRECASDTCAWLFLDTSRNRSRRWCDMSVCGNRDKARRFYRRRRSTDTP